MASILSRHLKLRTDRTSWSPVQHVRAPAALSFNCPNLIRSSRIRLCSSDADSKIYYKTRTESGLDVLKEWKSSPDFDPNLFWWGFMNRILRLSKLTPHDEDLTKDQVRAKVFWLIISYPFLILSKITEEAHFEKDLEFNEDHCAAIVAGLQVEFKLIIPREDYLKTYSPKLATEYIYSHLHQRVPFEDVVQTVSSWKMQCLSSDSQQQDKDYVCTQAESEYDLILRDLNIVTWGFMLRIMRFSLLTPHDKDLTKEQVMAKVVEVVRSFPFVSPSLVTEESDFVKDLGLSLPHAVGIVYGLEVEFKINMPSEDRLKILSCKLAADYMYSRLDQRVPMKDYIAELTSQIYG